MDERPAERKLAAILSADVEGYSRLMGEDELGTVRAITESREVIGASVARHGGRVVDAPGDNVLAEFASVVDAVQSAVEIQRTLQARNAELPPGRRMRFRIGINLGDVIVQGQRLYGEGVNIAARLEGLAGGGDICLSGTAYDQIEGKLPFAFEFSGEHTVKNIARPVRVYRLRLEPGSAPASRRDHRRPWLTRIAALVAIAALLGAGGWAGWRWLRPSESAGLALPDKPSVAVLPFANLSQDPAQEYFSDGVTEDLITGLSKMSGLFVIARNSVFTYKGKPVNVRDVGRDLGVRYVLEGGVQRAGNRVRITAQLVDARSGYHLWAERYDREVRDIFGLQDEVTQQIVRALAVKVTEAEKVRIGRAPTAVFEAYDLALRGDQERQRTTREGNAEARRLFTQATALDPRYAAAYVGLGWAHLQSWQFLWSADRELEQARDLAERAIALDNTLADGYRLLAQTSLWQKQHERAIAEAQRSVELGPNDASAYETLAEILCWSGRPEESIRLIRHAMRLDPHYPFFYLWTLGHAYFLTEKRQEALDTFAKLVQQNPNFVPAHAYRAVLLSELGRMQEAQQAWEQASRISPGASMANIRERLPYKRPADLDRVLSAAHRAGVQ
ncbi:MAG: adenylate/guanylate cyclase domain-containing protein [Candidatus Rokuibacteriota bacterium]|nr:MAG: adenylate/guanylate cyclase domain-containing protein [Candidatus Rokubacteria bacterium]